MAVKLSDTQRAILAYMTAGHATYLAYYGGPPGAEGRGAGYFWRQHDRSKVPPKVPGASVNGLVRRGLLQYAGEGDYTLTDAGRQAA